MWPFAPRMTPPPACEPEPYPTPVESTPVPATDGCGWCREPVPADSVSEWWCSAEHQKAWLAAGTAPWPHDPTAHMTPERCSDAIRRRLGGTTLGGAT